jgi:hypothetical protein
LQRLLDKSTEHGLLNPIGADPFKLRTSLYADGVLFIRPTASDVSNLQGVLQAFRAATRLNTNMHKSDCLIQTPCSFLHTNINPNPLTSPKRGRGSRAVLHVKWKSLTRGPHTRTCPHAVTQLHGAVTHRISVAQVP